MRRLGKPAQKCDRAHEIDEWKITLSERGTFFELSLAKMSDHP